MRIAMKITRKLKQKKEKGRGEKWKKKGEKKKKKHNTTNQLNKKK